MSDEEGPMYTYPGGEADVRWDGRLCIHVGECGRAKGELFVGGRKPWCQPDLVSVEDVVEVVRRCPTGALSVVRKGGEATEEPIEENVVVIANNGSLFLRGELEIEGAADDMPSVRRRAALCRCGESANKPFCDNRHEDAGFRDSGAVGETGEGAKGERGPLRVGRAKNGPLLLSGSFSIVGSGGRVAWRGSKAALCRCGQSANKPFCDGSHKAAGFEAD